MSQSSFALLSLFIVYFLVFGWNFRELCFKKDKIRKNTIEKGVLKVHKILIKLAFVALFKETDNVRAEKLLCYKRNLYDFFSICINLRHWLILTWYTCTSILLSIKNEIYKNLLFIEGIYVFLVK
jgi:hypothetical protein